MNIAYFKTWTVKSLFGQHEQEKPIMRHLNNKLPLLSLYVSAFLSCVAFVSACDNSVSTDSSENIHDFGQDSGTTLNVNSLVAFQGHIPGTLAPNETLHIGEALWSPGHETILVFRNDNDLAVYDTHFFSTPRKIWSTGTKGTSADRLVMQTDGNLVLYGPDDNGQDVALWSSETHSTDERNNNNATASIQDDGNLVVYHPNNDPLFATHTVKYTIAMMKDATSVPSYLPYVRISFHSMGFLERGAFYNVSVHRDVLLQSGEWSDYENVYSHPKKVVNDQYLRRHVLNRDLENTIRRVTLSFRRSNNENAPMEHHYGYFCYTPSGLGCSQ